MLFTPPITPKATNTVMTNAIHMGFTPNES